MPLSEEQMLRWCRSLLGADDSAANESAAQDTLELKDYLAAIPKLETLNDLPAGSPVLVRGDVDAKPGEKIGQGDVRLRSMVETLKYGLERDWKLIICGHIGRKPEGTLAKAAARLGELLGAEVPLVADWLNEESLTISAEVEQRIAAAKPGSVMVLENTRRYEIERALWKATLDDLPALAPKLARLANEVATKIAPVFINEAISAGSVDASSTIFPAAMDQAVLGAYVASELTGPLLRCIDAQVVVFSGLKADKLDDMEAMIDRGAIRCVFSAGSLAMALKKAEAQLAGGDFPLGVAEHPDHRDKPYFIPPERIAQAKRMIEHGRRNGVDFVLPVDFVLRDGRTVEALAEGDQQLDVGPKTSALFASKVGELLAAADGKQPLVAFYNGVFGMFEDERYEAGTRSFIGQLKRMTDAGAEVYVGGGEGGKALEKYGQSDWVTHCFTAGGTVLNALSGEPIPYLAALRMAAASA